jgi:hypothetical protein
MTEEAQNELIPIKKLENPLQIFTKKEMDTLVDEIRKKALDFEPDTSTDKGRRKIASQSYKVSTSKTALIGLSNELTEEWRIKKNAVDAVRIKMCSDLDDVRDEVRKPLTDYEDAEKKKLAKFEEDINAIELTGSSALECWQDMEDDNLDKLQKTIASWECKTDDAELQHKFNLVKEIATNKINLAIEKRKAYDKEQAELKALREADAKRQEEEDERLAKEAEKALRDEQDRLDAVYKAKLEKERADAAEKAKQEAEQKAKEDAEKVAEEQDLLTATLEQNKRDADATIQKQKDDAALAKLESDKRADQAAANERQKIRDEENKRLADEKRREADIEHQRKFNKEAVDGLVAAGMKKDMAIVVIKAIIVGDVPHVKLSY